MDLTQTIDPCSDMGFATWFVERFGDRVRYVPTWGKWLAWDETRWLPDHSAVMRFAMQAAGQRLGIALAQYAEAQRALGAVEAEKGDVTEAKKAVAQAQNYVNAARRSQQTPRIQAMLALAPHARAVGVDHRELDADPFVLNVANGILDLRTGKLGPHDPAKLCTKIAPVEYDPTATAPTWDAFLNKSLGADVELIGFLRHFTGYCLTGAVTEHCLVFNYGDGGNGKSTYTRAIVKMLGDYAGPAPRSLLFRSRSERHPTELATLVGLRFAPCSEVGEDQALDEAKLKDLTGGDPISARRMNEDFWSFDPTHKLAIGGNHRPQVSGTDEGIWRRIRLVPWTVAIPRDERDPDLPEKLDAELAGILAWAVRGCLEWQRSGLGAPKAVTDATATYREESDPLGDFFRLRCAFAVDAKVPRKMLQGVYKAFCEENGTKPMDPRTFAAHLKKRGVEDGGTVRINGLPLDAWRGVRLLDEREREGLVVSNVPSFPNSLSSRDLGGVN